MRTWFYSINSKYPLFLEDRVYDERLLGALDWISAVARAYGLKLILSFTDFWPDTGGITSFMLTSRKSSDLSAEHSQYGRGSFFTGQNYFSLYISHVERMLLRKSKITDTRYCDESAVMAWELMVSLFLTIFNLLPSTLCTERAKMQTLWQGHITKVDMECSKGSEISR